MQVQIRLHGILRDKVPVEQRGRTTITLPENASVQAVLDHFDLERIVSVAVNDEIEIHPDHPLKDGDCVELFRVVGGG